MADARGDAVVIVADEPLVARALTEQLRAAGYRPETAESIAHAHRMLEKAAPAAVLLDLNLPDGNGLDLLPRLRRQWPEVPVLVMTGHGSIESAEKAMRQGAVNYITKPMAADELCLAIESAVETSRLRLRAEEERQRNTEIFSFDRIVAQSAAMRKAVEQARIVADSRATTVLLLGESGTGKGLMAGAIHYASRRSPNPFLKVMCSAIPETLLEAEMFGHEKGAFTDAKERRRGVFESADGGTVFLDEIGDMPAALQAKLLGVIEDKSFSRIGGTQRIEVDVRIVAATHRDLERSVEESRFREDLLYRLRVVPIVIPPLRERREDVRPLAQTFLEEFNREFARKVEGFEPSAVDFLESHTWQGNVRELRNVIERAMLFSRGKTLTMDDLALDLGYRPRATKGGQRYILPPDGVTLEKVEEDLIRQAMQRCDNNQSQAAKLLGLSRDQLRYRLDKMGLLPNQRRSPDERA